MNITIIIVILVVVSMIAGLFALVYTDSVKNREEGESIENFIMKRFKTLVKL
mgnify:CR=1 FL=1